jgi:hypothetical protein
MKLAIVGSRTFSDYELLKEEIDKLRKEYKINEIVSGGANGADKLAEKYAKENNLKLTVFPAKWDKYGKKAGWIRNKQIWEYADCGVAFWDGKSKGTQHSFKLAEQFRKELKIVKFNNKKNKLKIGH